MNANPDPITNLLQRLPGAKKTANGWEAKCPAHDDNRASLSVTRAATTDGRSSGATRDATTSQF